MRRFGNFLVAFAVANLLAVFGGAVGVHAQRPFLGGLFYLGDSAGTTPGAFWIPPPRRAWNDGGGDEWATATSYPARLWEREVAGAPPNDGCFGVGETAVTDVDVGPYGLQTVQYFADWWDGQVYFQHPNPPAGWDAFAFGYFSFLGPHSSGRVLVDSSGVVQSLPSSGGSPGACVGHYLSSDRGDGRSGVWEPRLRNGAGDPCFSTQTLFRLRFNTELRCEPDLRDRTDPYTQRFWPPMLARMAAPPPLPDGDPGVVLFPPDYSGRYPWFRRADGGFHEWIHSAEAPGPTEAFTSVFNGSVPGFYDAVRRYRSGAGGGNQALDYLEHHAWRFAGQRNPQAVDPAAVRADERNPMVTIGPDGRVTDDQMVELVDPLNGRVDCLSFSGISPGSAGAVGWPCGRPNSMLPSMHTLEAGGERVVDVGAKDMQELLSRGVLTPSVITVADGGREPQALGGVWQEWRDWSMECTWLDNAAIAIDEEAWERVLYWDSVFWTAWDRMLALNEADFDDQAQLDNEYDVRRAIALEYFGYREGWRVIYEYRVGVIPELRSAFAGAGYSWHDGYRFYPAVTGCVVPSFGLWPIAPHPDFVGPASDGGGIADPGDRYMFTHARVPASDMQPVSQERPHYLRADDLGMWTGPVSRRLTQGGTDYPAGLQLDADITDAPVHYAPIACNTIDMPLFAPDQPYITPDYQAGSYSTTEGGTLNLPEPYDSLALSGWSPGRRRSFVRTESGRRHPPADAEVGAGREGSASLPRRAFR